MTKSISTMALGAALLATTLVLAVVGVESVTGVQAAIVQAVLKAPTSPALENLLITWPILVLPLLFCLVTPIIILLFASIMAFRGELKISLQPRCHTVAK